MHSDNQKLLHKLQNKVLNNWDNHIAFCAGKDRQWLQNMQSIASLFEQHQYDYIYKIFKQFVPVFEVTQYWTSNTDYMSQLASYWRIMHRNTMQPWCQLLTRTVNHLEDIGENKIDSLKQAQHKKTKDKEEELQQKPNTMDIDTDEEDTDEIKDETFETMDIRNYNKFFDLETKNILQTK